MIIISSRYSALPSFRYIANLLLSDWYTGHKVIFDHSSTPGYSLTFDNGKEIHVDSPFFEHVYNFGYNVNILDNFTTVNVSLPKRYRDVFDISTLPIIDFSPTKAKIDGFERYEEIKFDIFGACFFLITRLDEYQNQSTDQHDRFPGTASLASKHGYLYLPLADIYSILFTDYVKEACQTQLIPNTTYDNNVTCDVDNPFLFQRKFRGIIKRAGADIVLRKNMTSGITTLLGALLPNFTTQHFDPFKNGIDYIMRVNDMHSNSVRFNFIPLHTSDRYDGENIFESKILKELLRQILDRGHKIGIHPGFETYMSAANMNESVKIFTDMIYSLNGSEFVSGRQHYLRWKTGITETLLDNAGVNEDSSLSFADTGGFRCGTSRPFTLYDLAKDAETKVIEKPLIVMETSYFGQGYLNVPDYEIFNEMSKLKNWSKKVDGTFSLLWHNCGLQTRNRREIYEQLLMC